MEGERKLTRKQKRMETEQGRIDAWEGKENEGGRIIRNQK